MTLEMEQEKDIRKNHLLGLKMLLRHLVKLCEMKIKVWANIIGWCATSMSAIFLIPQIYLTFKKKDALSLSLFMLGCIFFSSILWTIYGIHFKNLPLSVNNISIFILNILLIGLKIYYTIAYKNIF
ncbi:PQ-loop domain-containing transporter [Spiroplasma clarkii]|uniref:SemiSWEET family sugar transporter n=1 Tax=Spiroplasma clarkii TaxID=2139 RepID=UPI0011BA5002